LSKRTKTDRFSEIKTTVTIKQKRDNLQIRILVLGATELLTEIDKILFANTTKESEYGLILLCSKYEKWSTTTEKFLTSSVKLLDWYTEWLTTKRHFPSKKVELKDLHAIFADLENIKLSIKERLAVLKKIEAEFTDKQETSAKAIEFHYTQTKEGVRIQFGNKKYVPRKEEYKNLLKELARHFGDDDPEVSGKPFRLDLEEYEKKKMLQKIKHGTLHTINRQLGYKEIPLRFDLDEDLIFLRKLNSVEIKYV